MNPKTKSLIYILVISVHSFNPPKIPATTIGIEDKVVDEPAETWNDALPVWESPAREQWCSAALKKNSSS